MSGYRPPSTEPRGKWAIALDKKARELGISQTGVFEQLREGLGLGPKSRSAYLPLHLGVRPPTDAEAKVLADWLGYWPEDVEPGEGGSTGDTSAPGLSELIAKLDAQTAAFNRLAGAIERMVDRPYVVPPALAQELRRAVEAEAQSPDTPSPLPRPDRPPTAEAPRTGSRGTGSIAPVPSGSSRP